MFTFFSRVTSATVDYVERHKVASMALLILSYIAIAQAKKWVMDDESAQQDPCYLVCSYAMDSLHYLADGGVETAIKLLDSLRTSDLLSSMADNITPEELCKCASEVMNYCSQQICTAAEDMSHCMPDDVAAATQETARGVIGLHQMVSRCG